MKNIRRLVHRLEREVLTDDSPKVPIILTNNDDLIGVGYFADKDEETRYVCWRVAQIRKGIAPPTEPYDGYTLDRKDVEQHIEAFREAQDKGWLRDDEGDGWIMLPVRDDGSAF